MVDENHELGRKPKGYRNTRREHVEQETPALAVQPRRHVPPFTPKTDRQARYAALIDSSTYTFCVGPAGTGKTFVAAAKACEHLTRSPRTSVVLTRPAVEAAGEKLGFLPGELHEKFGPYMKPLLRLMIDRLGAGFVECAIKNERIRMIPMAFMRGETFDDALIIADEMQNATREQLKMLLTRLGAGSRMIIDGDPEQTDIGDASGLDDALYRLRHVEGVGIVHFERSDIVRHSIIQDVIDAYETHPLKDILKPVTPTSQLTKH
jgi:phosphate starvation-inducible PhoH-like protein